MVGRKYSIEEIDNMRGSIRAMYGTGSYDPKERNAEVEDRLRTHMQNGTEPQELAAAASARITRDYEAQQAAQKFYEERRKSAPPPRVLKTKEDVIDEWFQTKVAQYEGASVEAEELYDGFGGATLKSFANRHAPEGVNITQRDMEKYLDAKGIKCRNAMFAKRYDGIRHVISGDVRSGNYST